MSEAAAPPEIVVDTSVALKWFSTLGEGGVDDATRLFESHLAGDVALLAPASLALELANALRYSRVARDDVLEFVGSLHLARIELVEMSSALLAEAVRLAFEHDLTVYDAVFLALAEDRGCALVTADRRAFAGLDAGIEVRLV